MVKPAKTKKQYRKRYYKKRYYKKRYGKKYRFRKFRKSISPEIQQMKGTLEYIQNSDGTLSRTRGAIYRLINPSTQSTATEPENVIYNVNNRVISGNKIKLKWLYIKGYLRMEDAAMAGSGQSQEVNVQIKIFRLFKNLTNSSLNWSEIVQDNINYSQIDTDAVQRQLLYLSDMKNDLKGKLWIKTKKLYRKYTPINSFIPFKIRIPLYDAVVQCDCYKSGNNWVSQDEVSTNGLYISVLSPNEFPMAPYGSATTRPFKQLYMKYKIYYTDN